MELQEKKVIYDTNFSITKSNDNTLKINNTSDVATNKNYYAIGNLREDENYIFDSAYKPMYCSPSYAGCYNCVSSCDDCQGGCQTNCQECVSGCNGGCQTSCQNSCYDGCNGGCQSGCQSNCQSGCNSGCTSNCQSGCNGSCNSACQNANGCASCDADCQAECNASTVGCPASLYTRSMLNYFEQYGCGTCNSKVSCDAYVSNCSASCHACFSTYECTAGCRSSYTCSIYVACSSACMTCNASDYTCDAKSCYSKVYKWV